MTSSEAGAELTRVKDNVGRVGRRLATWRALAWLGGLAALVAAGVWAPVGWIESPGSAAPMFLLIASVVVAVACGLSAGRALRHQGMSRVAREIERAAHLADGELRGALELGCGAHGSAALTVLQRDRVSRHLAGRPRSELLPESSERLREAMRRAVPAFGGGLLLLLTGLAARPAGPGQGAAMARPWSVTFPPPPPPLVLQAWPDQVLRGEHVDVRVSARGRRRVRLTWSVPGEPRGRLELNVWADTGAAKIGPIVATTAVWAEDERGERSDTLRIRPVDPLMVTDVLVDLTYPAYLDRPDDELAGPPPGLTVPEGTKIRLRGRASHPLRKAALVRRDAAGDTVSFRVKDGVLTAEMEARRGGRYGWSLAPLGRVPAVREPPDMELVVVPDRGPTVDIVYPEADLTLGMNLPLSLVIDARDDHAIASLELVAWRESAAGVVHEAVRVPGPADGTFRRIAWRPTLELGSLGILPGETLAYFARATDANPRAVAAASDTFRVYVRTLADMKAARVSDTDHIASDAAGLDGRARDLASGARAAERRAAAEIAASPGPTPARDPAVFASTEEARQLLQEAAELESDVEGVVERLGKLRRSLETAPLPDPALRDRLARLEELYREVLDSGLGERLAALEEALRSLARDELREALDALARDAERAGRDLERALGLLERVALEQSLKGAGERVGDLAERQERQAARGPRDAEWAGEQRALEEEASELEADLDRLADRLQAGGAGEPGDIARGAGRDVAGASEAMRAAHERAASEVPRGGIDGGSAVDDAQRATQALERAREKLDTASESLANGWKAEAIEAVERATSQALQLAAEQADVVERLEAGSDAGTLGGRQASLREGMNNLVQALAEAGKKSALLDQRSGSAASRAGEAMDAVGRGLAKGPAAREEAARQGEAATEAVSDLAESLIASRRAMSGSASGTGLEEALERLAAIGQRQASLNGETGDLFLLRARGEGGSERLGALADRQAELSRQLAELAARPEAEGLVGRPQELAREADEIARRMTAGELDREVLTRQERLFRRLLDAGRTLERNDEDAQHRESLAARRRAPSIPAEPAPQVHGGPRYPYPTDRELEGLTASQRRVVYEYFDRLNADERRGSLER